MQNNITELDRIFNELVLPECKDFDDTVAAAQEVDRYITASYGKNEYLSDLCTKSQVAYERQGFIFGFRYALQLMTGIYPAAESKEKAPQ